MHGANQDRMFGDLENKKCNLSVIQIIVVKCLY